MLKGLNVTDHRGKASRPLRILCVLCGAISDDFSIAKDAKKSQRTLRQADQS